MRTILSITILLLFGFQLKSQPKGSKIENRMKTIGQNLLTNQDIPSREYLFSQNITAFVIDSTTNSLTVQLRGTSKNGKWLSNNGKVIRYDPSANSVKWEKPIFYDAGDLHLHPGLIIQRKGSKSYRLNPQDGTVLWKARNNFFYIDPLKQIGMGYRLTGSRPNNMMGFDLKSGKLIWNRYISREYGWNDVFRLNDSIVVIVAAGLHAVNLYTGEGWDFDTVTGKKDYTETAVANAAGLVLGALTGTFVVSTGYNLVSDVRSNVVTDSSSFYFASKSKITRLDHSGKITWRMDLPEDLTSKSTLVIRDSSLYLINSGYAFMGNRQVKVGKPFFAAYDLQSGRQKYLTHLTEKKDQLKDFRLRKDTILFLFDDKASIYSMNDGVIISEKSFDTKATGQLVCFLGDQSYLRNDSTYSSAPQINAARNYLLTSGNRILITDNELNVLEETDDHQLFLCHHLPGDYKFLSKGYETVVLNKQNKEVAKLEVSGDAVMAGKKIYYVNKNSLIEVNLEDIPISN